MRRASDWTWWNEAREIASRHARGASDAAEDLAQDLAVATLERGADVQRQGAWLERVGRNAVIDGWRLERRRRELGGDIDVPAGPPDPEQGVLAGERRGVVRRALAALPRPLRRAALARFLAELPFDEVAARLGTAPVTARTRVHRALARLRARVAGLRAFVPFAPGAQAAALGVALVVTVARPAAPPAVVVTAPARIVREHARRVAGEPLRAAPAVPEARASAPRAPRPASHAPAGEAAFPPAVQRLSFGDDLVEAELAGPDGLHVMSEPVVEHLSLIELRWHFLPEIVKTLEDL